MKQIKILIVDKHCPEDVFKKLEEKDFSVTVKTDADKKELSKLLHDFECIVISGHHKLDKSLLLKAEQLKLIIRAGSGMEIIDTHTAMQKGITCLNTPEGNRNAVAEHCMGLILSLLHKISQSNIQVKNKKWKREENRGIELSGKKIGLLGYGNTGMSLAQKLKSFNVEVLAYDKFKYNFSDDYAQEATMDQLFEKTDILSIHLPLTEETRGIVNLDFIQKFKKPFYLINTARGEIVHHAELAVALSKGLVKGAGLDVLENEKIESLNNEQKTWFEEIAQMENVIITPHVAGWTQESRTEIGNYTLTKILKFFGRE